MSARISYDIDTGAIDKLAQKKRKALSESKQRALVALGTVIIRDSDPYVPFMTGMLSQTPMVSSDLESGTIVYDTPYAARQYYGDSFDFRPDTHPQATARWFEHAREEHKGEWKKVAKEAYGGIWK